MPFVPWGPVIGNIPPPLPVASGGTGATTAAAGLTDLGGLVLQASTPAAGVALINGTQNILTWTAPVDGGLHYAYLVCLIVVATAETGGAIGTNLTEADNTSRTPGVNAGGAAAGAIRAQGFYMVHSGSAVTVQQTSALTAGAATIWAQLWGI